MAITVVDVPETTRHIKNTLSELDVQDQTIKRVEDTVLSLPEAWNSDAQREFEEQFRPRKAKADEFGKSMRSYLQTMQTFVNDCGAVDQSVSAALQKINW